MNLLSRIPRALILGFLLLLIPVGAVLAEGREETGGQPESDTDVYKSHDDLLLEVSVSIPDFGGMYLSKDNRILNVYVLAGKEDVLDTEEVKRAIEAVLKADATSRRELRLVPAQYSMSQLYGWYQQMQDDIWGISGVITTDLNEGRNRIEIGIENLEVVSDLQKSLTALAIPRKAVIFREREQPNFATHTLQDGATGGFLEGGYQVARSGSGGCTLGFNAQRAGVDGFITAGHCTDNFGEVDDTLFYQPSSAVNPNAVGIEISDPPFNSSLSGCPSGKECRYSDSAFIELKPTASANRGIIAKPIAMGTGTVNHVDEFRIVDDSIVLSQGQTVHKVGKTTYWTSGTITQTCQKVYSSGKVLLCQHEMNSPIQGGDSGSPVFVVTDSPNQDDVKLAGLIFAGTTSGWFSPIAGIYHDLGATASWKLCHPSFNC